MDWRQSITQHLQNVNQFNHVDTHEELGLFSSDTETYFPTEDGLKHQLSDGEVKLCITREDAYKWIKRMHESQNPHMIKEEILVQTHKGSYWWPTISLDVEYVINGCETCQ